MSISNEININDVLKLRSKILEGIRRVMTENPDRLNVDELNAVLSRCFALLNELDMGLGFECYDTKLKRPDSIPEWQQIDLYNNFIDWYNILPTGGRVINGYVQKNYPNSKYKRVICVGDGRYCHLGRRLASEGYDVVVVDPVSKKEFARPADGKSGRLHIVNGEFYRASRAMIDWADIIVGAKVPLCAEDLTKLDKPTVFSISDNPEIYKMRYNGVLITSAKQLQGEIEKSPRVKRVNYEDYIGNRSFIYVCDGRDKEDMDEYGI